MYLGPGHEGEEKKEDAGGQLSAGQQRLGLLPELQVHQEDCHSPFLLLFLTQLSKMKDIYSWDLSKYLWKRYFASGKNGINEVYTMQTALDYQIYWVPMSAKFQWAL